MESPPQGRRWQRRRSPPVFPGMAGGGAVRGAMASWPAGIPRTGGLAREWQGLDGAMAKAPTALEPGGGATGACWLTDGACPCRWCPAAQTPMMPSRSPPPWTALPSGVPAKVRPGRTPARMPVRWADRLGARPRKGAMPRTPGRAAKSLQEWTRTLVLRQGAGWLGFATPGLTGPGNSWCAMKKWIGAISAGLCWPLRPSCYGK